MKHVASNFCDPKMAAQVLGTEDRDLFVAGCAGGMTAAVGALFLWPEHVVGPFLPLTLLSGAVFAGIAAQKLRTLALASQDCKEAALSVDSAALDAASARVMADAVVDLLQWDDSVHVWGNNATSL